MCNLAPRPTRAIAVRVGCSPTRSVSDSQGRALSRERDPHKFVDGLYNTAELQNVGTRSLMGALRAGPGELWVTLISGGAEEDRTPDLRIANATLSQLSYGPT